MESVWLFEMEDIVRVFSTREKAIQHLKEKEIPHWMKGNGEIAHEEHSDDWSLFTVRFPAWEEMNLKGFSVGVYIGRYAVE